MTVVDVGCGAGTGDWAARGRGGDMSTPGPAGAADMTSGPAMTRGEAIGAIRRPPRGRRRDRRRCRCHRPWRDGDRDTTAGDHDDRGPERARRSRTLRDGGPASRRGLAPQGRRDRAGPRGRHPDPDDPIGSLPPSAGWIARARRLSVEAAAARCPSCSTGSSGARRHPSRAPGSGSVPRLVAGTSLRRAGPRRRARSARAPAGPRLRPAARRRHRCRARDRAAVRRLPRP